MTKDTSMLHTHTRDRSLSPFLLSPVPPQGRITTRAQGQAAQINPSQKNGNSGLSYSLRQTFPLEAAQHSRFSFLLASLTFPSSWPLPRHGQGYLRDLWPGSNKEEMRLPNTSQRIHLKPA